MSLNPVIFMKESLKNFFYSSIEQLDPETSKIPVNGNSCSTTITSTSSSTDKLKWFRLTVFCIKIGKTANVPQSNVQYNYTQ